MTESNNAKEAAHGAKGVAMTSVLRHITKESPTSGTVGRCEGTYYMNCAASRPWHAIRDQLTAHSLKKAEGDEREPEVKICTAHAHGSQARSVIQSEDTALKERKLSFRPWDPRDQSQAATSSKVLNALILRNGSMAVAAVTTRARPRKEITELKKKISSTEQQLRSTSTPEDFKGLKDKVDKTVSDLRDSLQIRKRNKFLHDTEDYRNNQVYKWQFTHLFQEPETDEKGLQSVFHQFRKRFWFSTLFFFRTTSRPGLQRKTRRGQRTRIRTTPDGDQVPGTDTTNNIVYNISSQCLSPTELNVLERGLSFCPVPRFNSFQVDQELNRFFRNIRLKAHFSKTLTNVPPISDSTDSEFTLKSLNLRTYSSFQPPHVYHPVETYIELVKNDVKKVLESIDKGNYHVRHNLTVEEKRALSTLKDNKQIIIKPADKGGSIVVLDRDYYMHEIRTQLRDLDTYQPIGNNPTFEISREIKDLVTYYTTMGTIDTKLGDFLVKQHPVIPVFYTLPKIHKHPLRPPGRPIVASTESLLSPLAMTLEKILSPPGTED
ncbi:unnamed protein product [Ranitomeya imitator]|uniref:Uncharacterized protein n=1 Tax=Ranitomeya imitator TaxID=111125 RepID=A0ABN9MHC9_9NEOB|nr:unnamed protein product [Ranitomeya imitator]